MVVCRRVSVFLVQRWTTGWMIWGSSPTKISKRSHSFRT